MSASSRNRLDRNDRFWRIVLQNSQKALRQIFCQRTKQETIADQCRLKPVTGIACEFVAPRRNRPLLFDRRTYGLENLSPMPRKYFCNTIGAKRTFLVNPIPR
jgi:hypothetical protein